MKISTVARPYMLTFLSSGHSYPLTSEEAQRVLERESVVSASRNRVVLYGHNTPDPKQRIVLQPATRGGGAAFLIER